MKKRHFTKFTNHLQRKIFSKTRREPLKSEKGQRQKTQSGHHTQWTIEHIALKIRNRTKLSAFITSIQCCTGCPVHCSKARKRNKRYKDWKRRNNLSLNTNDMIVYIENRKESMKQLLEITNKLIKFVGYRLMYRNKFYSYTLIANNFKNEL